MNHAQPNHPPLSPRPSLDVPFDEIYWGLPGLAR